MRIFTMSTHPVMDIIQDRNSILLYALIRYFIINHTGANTVKYSIKYSVVVNVLSILSILLIPFIGIHFYFWHVSCVWAGLAAAG